MVYRLALGRRFIVKHYSENRCTVVPINGILNLNSVRFKSVVNYGLRGSY